MAKRPMVLGNLSDARAHRMSPAYFPLLQKQRIADFTRYCGMNLSAFLQPIALCGFLPSQVGRLLPNKWQFTEKAM
jgi:hypothetical protein